MDLCTIYSNPIRIKGVGRIVEIDVTHFFLFHKLHKVLFYSCSFSFIAINGLY